ncbi:MAG: hypothetical protein HY695_02130 [Deltaproteobacteria bacterium]|nr:hypothetical protein [Deltaproteobacteria bacterium]
MASDLTRSSSTQIEPILDATLASGPFSLNAGLRLREVFTSGSETESARLSENRWFGRFFFTPERLPTLSFQVDQVNSTNNLKTEDKTNTRYQFLSDYTIVEGWNLSYLFSDSVDEDRVTGQTRDRMNHLGTLGYTQSLWGGWLDLVGGHSISYAPSSDKFSASGTAEVERRLSRGFKAAADLTPANSSDVPLTEEPGIIAGTSLLPLELNTSVGFEQLIVQPVSQIRLNLTPQAPFIIPDNLELFLNFRVFFTNDIALTTWTELGGITHRFEPLESRFILTFAPTTARFFKVYVSRNDFGALIRATKIEALNLEPVTAGEKRDTTTFLHNMNTSVTWRPWSVASMSYTFSMSDLTQKLSTEPDSLKSTNGTHTAQITWDPHRLLGSTLTYQHNFADSNQEGAQNTTSDLYGLVFRSTPLPTLTGSLSLVHNDNRSEGNLERRADTGSLNFSAQLYRNLNLDSSYSLSRSQDFLIDQKSLRHAARLNATATLTPRLSAILGYGIEWGETEQPDLQTDILTHTATGSLTYTVSRLLNMNARYDFLSSVDATAFSQEYRLDWVPTPKLSSFFGYRRTQSDAAGVSSGSDSINVNGRWNMSRYINLNANFLLFRTFSGDLTYSIVGSAQLRF